MEGWLEDNDFALGKGHGKNIHQYHIYQDCWKLHFNAMLVSYPEEMVPLSLKKSYGTNLSPIFNKK